MCGTSNICGGNKAKMCSGNLKGRESWVYLSKNERTILKKDLMGKLIRRGWTRFICRTIQPIAGRI